MIQAVPTLFGDAVATHKYSVLFSMFGPRGPEEYVFVFTFNQKMGRWVLTIRDVFGQAVVSGAPVLLGVNLLGYANPALAPRGFLVAIWNSDTEGAREPGERDLGAWCELVYFERAEDLDDPTPMEPLRVP